MFIQILEFKTDRVDELELLEREWVERTKTQPSLRRATYCEDRDQAGRYIAIYEFDSYASAQAITSLLETQKRAARIAELSEKEPVQRGFEVRNILIPVASREIDGINFEGPESAD